VVLEGGEGYVEMAGEGGGALGGGNCDDAEAVIYSKSKLAHGEFGCGAGAEADEHTISYIIDGGQGGGLLHLEVISKHSFDLGLRPLFMLKTINDRLTIT